MPHVPAPPRRHAVRSASVTIRCGRFCADHARAMAAPLCQASCRAAACAKPIRERAAGDGGEHELAAVPLHRFQDRHRRFAQRDQMRGVGLRPARRQDQHPFREIDFVPAQVADLLAACTGQQQQLEDFAIGAEVLAGIPQQPDFVVGQGMLSGLDFATAISAAGLVVTYRRGALRANVNSDLDDPDHVVGHGLHPVRGSPPEHRPRPVR